MVRDITESDPRRVGRGRRAAIIAAAAITIGVLLLVQQRPSIGLPAPRPAGVTLPRSVGLLDMNARDYNNGWLATGSGLPPTQLWRTADGGKSWKAALSLEGTGSVDQVRFFDSRRGYLLLLTPAFDLNSNTMMVTADGGTGWQSLDFPKPRGMVLASLYESPEGEGRALFSAGANGDFGHQAAAVYTTHDGSSWSLAAQVDIEHFTSSGLSLQGSKGPMAFTDAAHGVIVSQLDVGIFGVYSTADGGGSWSFQQLTPPPGEHQSIGPAAVNVAAVDGALLVGIAFRESSTPMGDFVYRSLDRGASWSEPIEVPTVDGVSAPIFATDRAWWVPDAAAVEVTPDGGRSWVRTELGLPGTTRVQSIFPIDDRRAWAFAGGGLGPPTLLYETIDGGATWLVRKPPA